MINSLHNKSNKRRLVPKEGQQGLLCSNKKSNCCPSLGYISKEEEEKLKLLLKDLAKIFINKELENL